MIDFLVASLGDWIYVIWFVLVGILFTGYAMLDGFDLGVGILHLFARGDKERRIFLNSIGPVWDGNEVWLVTGGGALFAAFPMVYATVFSGFYLVFVFLLFAIIFRAVAIEFRGKQPMAWWRGLWDMAFSISSFASAFLIGVAIGNIAAGIELNDRYEYAGTFLDLLHPYALWIGVTTVALFAMHGNIYLVLKTEGEIQRRVRSWVYVTMGAFIVCYALATAATLLWHEHLIDVFREHPALGLLVVFNMLLIANIPREIMAGRDIRAFLSSCGSMALLMAVLGVGMYPNMVYSAPDVQNSMSIFEAASSPTTLAIMLVIAVIGVPLVLSYTATIYWIFRGKTKLGEHSY